MNSVQAKRERSRARGREGIALVVVLGCLAVLTILAMGFAVVMRTERIASATYMQVAQARDLTYSSLAHFMEQVDGPLVGNTVYPNWLAAKSADGTDLIVIPEAELYIPDAVFPTDAEKVAGWIPLELERIIPGPEVTMWGRFSWVAFNVSALLDVNHIGGAARGAGASPAELQIEVLPDIGNPSTFFGDRTDYKRFETVRELNALNPGGFTRPARTLTTFSYFPETAARRGLVNPNNLELEEADQVAILTTAFEGMDVNTYIPDRDPPEGSTTITQAMALEVAKGVRDGAPFVSPTMSDFETRLRVVVNNLKASDAAFDGMDTDDFINKCKNLFSNRQQLFIVVLAGQVRNEAGTQTLADARALAMVWRDPFAPHQSFVHFFKWLDE